MRKQKREIPENHKKIRKIVKIILSSVVGAFVLIIIIAAIAGPTTNDIKNPDGSETEKLTETSQESAITTQSTESTVNRNETQEALSKLVGDLTAYQVNASSDFQLASSAVDTTTGAIDTDAMAIYKNDFDSMLEKVKALDASTDDLINSDDLTDPDNKLFIDSHIQGTIDSLLAVLAVGSTTLDHAVNGSMSDQDITDLNSAGTMMNNLNTSLKAMQGIHDNAENWK